MLKRRRFLEGVVASALCLPQNAYANSFRLPDLEGFNEEGKATRLSEYYGNPILAHVWGSYCLPCIADLPFLNDLEQYIHVLGLYDMAGDDLNTARKKIEEIKEKQNNHAPNILLPTASLLQLNRAYVEQTKERFLAIPTYFLLTKDAECIYIHRTNLTVEKERKKLQRKIAQLQK